MRSKFMFLLLACALLFAGTAGAAIQSAADFLAEIQRRVDAGLITADEALLLKFQYGFEPARLPADLQPEVFAPMKSGTPLVIEYLQREDRLDPAIRTAIEGYLTPPTDRPSYFSPSGNFRLFYATTGADAVPPADANSNGIPDFVENCALYLDYSWQRECDELGFEAPPLNAQVAYMSIYFENMQYYGLTQPTGQPGITSITLENDFVGFPPNDDPDGDVLGAAKVTCAHEFKHSSQYAGSYWSEGGWVELDATWAEDIVFPLTNDYHQYLFSGSPISSPATPLDSGGTGSYEDCVWQHWMSQTFGNEIVVDLWNYRKTHQSQPMMLTYQTILQQYGSSVEGGWGVFASWNYATGGRANPPFGYEEAADYPSGSVVRTFNSYPDDYSGFVAHLAANWIRCLFLGDPDKRLQITFDGVDTGRFTLCALMRVSAAHGGGHYFYELEPDANNDGVFVLPVDLDTIYAVGIIIGNPNFAGGSQAYTVAVEKIDAAVAAPEAVAPALAISGNHPNPFNPSTRIAFSVDRIGDYDLSVFDVQGRALRTVASGRLDPGPHEVVWDGRDDGGRALPSGTYFARLSGAGGVAVHKLVLAK